MAVQGADHGTRAVEQRRRHRVDALGELLEHPDEPVGSNLLQALSNLIGIDHRVWCIAIEGSVQEPVDGRLRPVRQDHQTRWHDVHREARPGPVSDLDRIRTVDLSDVVDVVAGGNGQAHRLADHVDHFEHVRLCHGQEALGRVDARRHRDDRRSDAVAGAVGIALHGMTPLERGEQSGDRAGREADLASQVADAGGLARQFLEEPEGPVDALDGCHHVLRSENRARRGGGSRFPLTLVFHDTDLSRISGRSSPTSTRWSHPGLWEP